MGRSRSRYRLDEAFALTLLERMFSEAVERKALRGLLRGLFTESQRAEWAQRCRIAWYLRLGWSFRLAAAEAGASTATVLQVHRYLLTQNPRYRPAVVIRHRPRRAAKTPKDPFRNPHIPLSGKWLFRELTGTG